MARYLLQNQGKGDVIRDFEDGRDRLWLDSGLSFADLSIRTRERRTVIEVGDRTLATLTDVDSSLISQADFLS